LGSGFVMDRVEGETIPRKILRDEQYATARPHLAVQCGEIAARIHAVDVGGLPTLATQHALEQITQYRALIDGFGEPLPAFELGLRWLEDRAPPPPAGPALVHGDFRNGNFIVGPEGIRSVLDWELAHLGDPVEDLGWLCVKAWRFGHVDRPAGGFGSVDELLAGYVAGGGAPVDPEHLRFWQTLGTLKWGVICLVQAFTHLNARSSWPPSGAGWPRTSGTSSSSSRPVPERRRQGRARMPGAPRPTSGGGCGRPQPSWRRRCGSSSRAT
jgi:aminoglycoside phosphotransferase (APT) family kinase protein